MSTVEAAAVEAPKAGAITATPPVGDVDGTTENASLYVGDLDKDVQETHLFELFSEHGPVHSIRVCRDTVTRRSLGYAYVNFNVAVDADAAKNAKAKLNYHVLNGKAIRIMWANRNARSRADKSGNIFIKNLEKTVTTRLLHDTFADFGEILSCKVATDKDGNSKGYGFVHFSDPDAAKKAIDEVNGAQLGDSDKVVTVTEFISKQDRGDAKQNFTNVYVKNLPNTIQNEDAVRGLFTEFGTISSAACMKDDSTGKYFAFVNFDTHEAAQKAVKEMHEKELEGSKLYVNRAQTKAERQSILQRRYEQKRSQMAQQMEGKNVYVKNLAPAVDEDKLKAAFAKFGEMSSVKVMRDQETKKSRGFGFVCFTESSSAQEAVSQMATAMLEGKQLYVAFAQPKAIRAQQLQAAINMNLSGKPAPGKGPGMPALGFNGMGYPAMMPFPGRGMVPGMYPQMQQQMQQLQQLQQAGTRGNQNVPNGNAANGFNPMMGPGMMGPGMMHMGPNMMHMGMGMGGRGGRQGGRGGGRGGPAGGRGQMRPSARPMPRPQEQHMRASGAEPQGEESLAGRLANMPDDERKQQLGEMLFPRLRTMLLQRYNSEEVAEKLASKVTGMMLEMPAQTVLYLLETMEELTVKLDEALVVLRDHGAMPDGITV